MSRQRVVLAQVPRWCPTRRTSDWKNVGDDHEDLWTRFAAWVGTLVRQGCMSLLEERHADLASAPGAFRRLRTGGASVGKVALDVPEVKSGDSCGRD